MTAKQASGTVLCVVRHGDAGDALVDPERDARRPLSPRGRKDAKRVGRALARAALLPRDVWTSRLARAGETAERALEAAGLEAPVRATAALAPDAAPDRVLSALEENPPPAAEGPVVRWLVGHEPHVSRLVGLLVAAPPHGLALSKGSVAVVEFTGGGAAAGAGRLVGLWSPETLRTLVKRE